jgi:hypothetical protein
MFDIPKEYRKGATVTHEPKTWFDGRPVVGWPKQEQTGTICRVDKKEGDCSNATWIKVRWFSGRVESLLSYGCPEAETGLLVVNNSTVNS